MNGVVAGSRLVWFSNYYKYLGQIEVQIAKLEEKYDFTGICTSNFYLLKDLTKVVDFLLNREEFSGSG